MFLCIFHRLLKLNTFLIKVELQNKLSLVILLQGKSLRDKAKQLKAIEQHGKRLGQSNAFTKKHDYDTEKDSPGF